MDTVPAKSESLLPIYAQTVLVPIANPATASALLELGAKLASPDGGRLIALFVSLGSVEAEAHHIRKLVEFIAEPKEPNRPIHLITHISTSVARGILDVAREEGVDLIVLGLQPIRNRRSRLGTIVESVASTAPCNVLIYRPGTATNFSRIVIPVDGSPPSQIACHLGILLADAYNRPVEVVSVQDGYRPTWEGRGRIEESLTNIKSEISIKKHIITANDPANGLLSYVSERDLIILGFSEPNRLSRSLLGDFSYWILSRSPSSVILFRRVAPANEIATWLSRFGARFSLQLTRLEQEEVLWKAHEMSSPHLDYYVLIVISAVLASFGLLLNSAAVIIGAMLVAPLMQPLIGAATGFATRQIELVGRAILTLFQGVALALLVSSIIALLIPFDTPTSEMMIRSSPTFLDLGVALASGAIGAYALARKDIPSALAGVAIAAALMPPLTTVGLNVGMGNYGLALRAGLLFMTNMVCISLSGWGVFLWLGIKAPQIVETRLRYLLSLSLSVTLLIAVIVALAIVNSQESRTTFIERHIAQGFPKAEVVSIEIVPVNPLRIVATLRSRQSLDIEDVEDEERSLSEALEQPVQLDVVVLQVLGP